MKHIIMLMLLLATSMATAGETLRCKGRVIMEEDSMMRVLKYCGKPTYVDEYVGRDFNNVRRLYYSYGQITKIVTIEYGKVNSITTER